MEVLSATNPVPPSGTTPTNVPLGISGSTVPEPGPSEVVLKPLQCFRTIRPIFYNRIFINNTQQRGTRLFTYETAFPLGNFPNRYNTISAANDVSRPFVPWMLVLPYFSRLCKIDFDLHLTPVKVADCRVSLDLISTYDNLPVTGFAYSTSAMNNDSFYKILDSQDDELTVSVPAYWVSKFVQTDSSIAQVPLTGQHIMQPAFLPTTQMQCFIRGKYHPSMIQPISFGVLLTVIPRVTCALQIAGRSNLTAIFSELWSQTPAPWFLHSSVI